jgi:hypothetical protein
VGLELGPDERSRVWEIAAKTLNAAFLKAVVTRLPDPERRRALDGRLLDLGDRAARGTLRVVRCWGADIETPGDWATAVAALGLVAAVDDVEAVLDSAWTEQAVVALVTFGAPGAPALDRFLRSPTARRLDRDLLAHAIASCARHLPDGEWSTLLARLQSDPVLAAAIPPGPA